MFILPTFVEKLESLELNQLSLSENIAMIIHRDGTVVFHNQEWNTFAMENGADEHFLQAWTIGSNFWSCMGEDLRSHLKAIFEEASLNARVTSMEFDCSSPLEKRLHQMIVFPLPHDLFFISYAQREDIEQWNRDDAPIVACAHCSRVRQRVSSLVWHWTTIPEGGEISHGICPPCAVILYPLTGDPALSLLSEGRRDQTPG